MLVSIEHIYLIFGGVNKDLCKGNEKDQDFHSSITVDIAHHEGFLGLVSLSGLKLSYLYLVLRDNELDKIMYKNYFFTTYIQFFCLFFCISVKLSKVGEHCY